MLGLENSGRKVLWAILLLGLNSLSLHKVYAACSAYGDLGIDLCDPEDVNWYNSYTQIITTFTNAIPDKKSGKSATIDATWTFATAPTFSVGPTFSASISTLSSTNLSVLSVSTGSVLFVSSGGVVRGSDSLYWEYTGQNRLGLGTKSPLAGNLIDLVGGGLRTNYGVEAATLTTNNLATINSMSVTSTAAIAATGQASVSLTVGGSGSIDPLAVRTGSTDLFKVLVGGNTGIGTATPSSLLDVMGGSITVRGTNSGLRISGLASCNTIDTDAGGNLSCGTDDGFVFGKVVTSSNIINNAITGSNIGSAVIVSSHVVNNALTGSNIGSSVIISSHITPNAITGSNIGSNVIVSSHIVDATITGSDIATTASLNVAEIDLNTNGTSANVIVGLNDSDSGLYRNAASDYRMSVEGVDNFRFGAATNESVPPLLVQTGAVGAPSIAITGNTDTGIYNSGGSSITFTIDGSSVANFQKGSATSPILNLTLRNTGIGLIDSTMTFIIDGSSVASFNKTRHTFNQSAVRVSRAAAHMSNSGGTVAIPWDTVQYDNDGYYNSASSASLTVPMDGIYLIMCNIVYGADSNGYRQIRIYNSTTSTFLSISANAAHTTAGDVNYAHGGTTFRLTKGDAIQCQPLQNSGVSLNVVNGTSPYGTWMSITYIGN